MSTLITLKLTWQLICPLISLTFIERTWFKHLLSLRLYVHKSGSLSQARDFRVNHLAIKMDFLGKTAHFLWLDRKCRLFLLCWMSTNLMSMQKDQNLPAFQMAVCQFERFLKRKGALTHYFPLNHKVYGLWSKPHRKKKKKERKENNFAHPPHKFCLLHLETRKASFLFSFFLSFFSSLFNLLSSLWVVILCGEKIILARISAPSQGQPVITKSLLLYMPQIGCIQKALGQHLYLQFGNARV